MKALIDIQGLTYQHAGVPGSSTIPPVALQNINLQIEAGEFVAIIGSNGSGKTTFARHLNGLLFPTSGRVLIDGMDTRDPRHHHSIRSRVGMVFQYPEDQMIATTVEEDVAFGPENLGLETAEIRRRVDAAIQAAGIENLRQRPPHLLSAGQMQRVALAGVLTLQPDCIIFDEATAMLDPSGRNILLKLVQQLHSIGKTIIYITHFMEEAALADRVLVFHKGRIVMDDSPQSIYSQTDRLTEIGLETPAAFQLAEKLRAYLPVLPANLLRSDSLINAVEGLGATQSAIFHQSSNHNSYPINPEKAIIDVNGLSHFYAQATPLEQRALTDVHMVIAPGAIHGLAGSTGSGKSTLLQHLNGLYLPRKGRVRVGPHHLHQPGVDLKALRRMVGLVFQLPETQLFEQYVGDEIAFGPRQAGLRDAELRESVQRAMEMVKLSFEDYKDRLTFTLSGGERRKVALASVLALHPQVLLLDEPTAGLDPHARREVLEHLRQLRDSGSTLIVSSHRMEDLAELTDSLTILKFGQVVLEGSTQYVFSQQAMLEDAGLQSPLSYRVASGLRKAGWPIPEDVVRSADLLASLASLSGQVAHG